MSSILLLLAVVLISAPATSLGSSAITDIAMLLRRDDIHMPLQRLSPMIKIIVFNAKKVLEWNSISLHLFVGADDATKIRDALPATALQSGLIHFANIDPDGPFVNSTVIQKFQKVYNHSSLNALAYERSCMERWMIYDNYFNNKSHGNCCGRTRRREARDIIIFIDSDVALFENPNDLLSAKPAFAAAKAVEFVVIGWGWFVGFTSSSLHTFASLIMDIYTNSNGESFEAFKLEYADKGFREVKYQVSDMYIQQYYGDKCDIEGTLFLDNIRLIHMPKGDCYIGDFGISKEFNFNMTPPLFFGMKNGKVLPTCAMHYAGIYGKRNIKYLNAKS